MLSTNYFKVTFAPTSSNFFFSSSASALAAASLTTFGAASTNSLASFRPRPVTSRTTLITLILEAAGTSVSSTSNSVFSSSAAAPAPAAATTTPAAADTPNSSSHTLNSFDNLCCCHDNFPPNIRIINYALRLLRMMIHFESSHAAVLRSCQIPIINQIMLPASLRSA